MYHRFKISTTPEQREIILAFLGELPFDTFEETEEGLEAYVQDKDYSTELVSRIEQITVQFGASYRQEEVPYQNWNKTWEEGFEPICVGSFCGLRATFHQPLEGMDYEIVIDPEMAFGTGHHATTYMMIEAMEQLPIKGKQVFDYGCGTGVLAILAALMGAEQADAVDIEEAAYERTLANAERNEAHGISVYHGTIDAVPRRAYDLILANINRNVILNSLETLYDRLKAGGILLVSGILKTDQEMLAQRAAATGFEAQSSAQKGDWCCLQFLKPL